MFSLLPTEILLKIMEYLDLNSMVNLCEVLPSLIQYAYEKKIISEMIICEPTSTNVKQYLRRFPNELRDFIYKIDISCEKILKNSPVAKFLLNLKSLTEISDFRGNNSNTSCFLSLVQNNSKLKKIKMAVMELPCFHSFPRLQFVTCLFLYFNGKVHQADISRLKSNLPNLEYFWIHGRTRFMFNVLYFLTSDKMKEIFVVGADFIEDISSKDTMNQFSKYAIVYSPNEIGYLYKKKEEESQILKKLNIHLNTDNYLNMSHVISRHRSSTADMLEDMNLHNIIGFSTNICHFLEPKVQNNSSGLLTSISLFKKRRIAKGTGEKAPETSKFRNLINIIQDRCEIFELIGCSYRPSSLFELEPLVWNEYVLQDLSRLVHLKSLSLIGVEFFSMDFLKMVADTCPLKTLKLSVTNPNFQIFYNLLTVLEHMKIEHLRYEQVQLCLPNIETVFKPLQILKETIKRYYVLVGSINITNFTQLDHLSTVISKIPEQVTFFGMRSNGLTNKQINTLEQCLEKHKCKNATFNYHVTPLENANMKLNCGIHFDDYHDMIDLCTTVVDFKHLKQVI